MASFTAEQVRVATNITAIAFKWRASGMCAVPPLLHLAVTKQESQWHEDAVNKEDPGGSYGPYQINEQAHEGTSELAMSPWSDYAFYIVYQEWNRAYNIIKDRWELGGDRGPLVEEFAPYAQGSISWPPGTGAQRYDEALSMLALIS